MKKLIITFASFAALGMSVPVLASEGGSCHFHGSKPAKEETVLGCAVQRKDALAASGKIDSSWKALKHDKIEQVDGKRGKEWKVTFKNLAAKDKAKETLYVFFTLPGNFIAANFTGQ
jgi:hypothetical protein